MPDHAVFNGKACVLIWVIPFQLPLGVVQFDKPVVSALVNRMLSPFGTKGQQCAQHIEPVMSHELNGNAWTDIQGIAQGNSKVTGHLIK